MRPLISALYCLAFLKPLASSTSIPRYFERAPVTPRALSPVQIQQELGSLVSSSTSIFGSADTRYPNATVRWNVVAVPQIEVVVEPGEESDVAKIIQFCNENSIEFLAYNRGHGSPKSLTSFNGIQINMVNLQNITIRSDSKTAWFQGGVYDGGVTTYLWDKGYVATTGACDCVGLMGPGLGGGHGRHEGLYGMVSDNVQQFNLVLWNGTSIVVNKSTNSDLLWGLKGAGHNFGIVTSFEMNIHPRGPDTWHYHNYLWEGKHLKEVFTALNRFHNNGSTPVNMAINFGQFYVNASVSTTEPSIGWTFAYRGCAEDGERLLAPFNAIKSVWNAQGDAPYPEVSTIQGTGVEGFLCKSENTIRPITVAGLQVYNVTAQQQIFDNFKRRIATNPSLAVTGIIVHEGYSTAAVDAIPSDSSAYPFRSDHLLVYFSAILPPTVNSTVLAAAWDWAHEVRGNWNDGQPGRLPDAYVNYANGEEPLEQIYGHEPWRLERLRGLKAKYDPNNMFRFYNPIV